ncbi:cytochrome P450 [Polaromonas sp.]|uniref:cytochrome P450 n=1 Tax=Polaromonas sp. TaxID=1869339 RepID=UPI0025FBCC4B|nr:cytochrome P450 [Polaromonas sp.]
MPPALERPLMDAAFLANPYPTYRALREAGPIHWREEFFGGAWLVTRHTDVELVLKDPRFSAKRTGSWVKDREDAPGEFKGFQALFARALLFLDAPDHPRIRKVLNAGFRPEILQGLAPHIERVAGELLDRVAHQETFDFIEAVARPLPVRVMALLLGIEQPDDDFMAWSEHLASFIGEPQPTRAQARSAQTSLLAMGLYFESLLALRRKTPGDDLVSRLAQAQARGEIEGGAELLAQCAMLLFAGHETTRHLLGSSVHALLSHPAQWQRLVREPTLLPGAVRELLRFESPVQYTGRRVATDMVLHGVQLRRGELVLAMIGAASRDPARYPDPDVLDITRCHGPSLAFGSGPHVCIGAALTLLEARIVLGQLLDRWPGLSLAEAAPRWGDTPAYRGLVALPLRRRPAHDDHWASQPQLDAIGTEARRATALATQVHS